MNYEKGSQAEYRSDFLGIRVEALFRPSSLTRTTPSPLRVVSIIEMINPPSSALPEASKISSILSDIVGDIPHSSESAAVDPKARARVIGKKAAIKAGALSGMLAVPPGPLGLATVLPDLIGIWRLQQQMVADIAGAYGKAGGLNPASMVYCLFKHGGAALTRDLVVRAGERLLVREATVKSIQHVLNRIGMNVSQRLITKSVSRFIPLIGAVGVGAYAYYDTNQVARTAMALFGEEGGDGESEKEEVRRRKHEG